MTILKETEIKSYQMYNAKSLVLKLLKKINVDFFENPDGKDGQFVEEI